MANLSNSSEIASALQRSANSAQIAGVSFEQLASYITVVSSVTRKSSESIGESFKTMFARMQSVKAGANLDEFGDPLNNVEKTLESFNIKLRDTPTHFKDLSVVIDEINGKWKDLDNTEKSEIANAIAGVRQRENFLTMMENYNQVLEAQKIETESAGLAQQRYGVYLNGIEAALNKFQATWEGMWSETILDTDIKFFIDLGSSILQLIDDFGGLVPVLLSVSAAMIAMRAISLGTMFAQLWGTLSTTVTMLIMARQGLLEVADAEMVAASAGSVLMGVFGVLVGIATLLIINAGELFDSMTDLNEVMQKNYDLTTGNVDELDSLSGEYETLSAKTNKTAEDITRLLDIQDILNNKYGASADGINVYTAAMDGNTEAIKENIRWMKEKALQEAEDFINENKTAYDKANSYLNKSNTMVLGFKGTYSGTPEEKMEQIYRDLASGNLKLSARELKLLTDKVGAAKELVTNYQHYNNIIAANTIITRENNNASAEALNKFYKLGKYTRGLELNKYYGLQQDAEEAAVGVDELTRKFDEQSSVADDLASAVSNLANSYDAVEGATSDNIEALKKLLPEGENYLDYLTVENGKILINIPALLNLISKRYDDALATLYQARAEAIKNKESTASIDKEIELTKALQRSSILKISAIGNAKDLAKSTSGAASATKELTEAQEKQIKSYERLIDGGKKRKDNLQNQLKAYKDIIDAKKESLRLDKEERDYEDELKDKKKTVTDIEGQILEIQNDNSEEGKARRLELEQEYADAKEELSKYEADRSYEIQVNALDAEYEAFENMIDKQIAAIDKLISKWEELAKAIRDALKSGGGAGGNGGGGDSTIKKYKSTTADKAAFDAVAQSYLNQYNHDGYSSGGAGRVPSGHPNDSAFIPVESDEIFAVLNRSQQAQIASNPLASMISMITGGKMSMPQLSNNNNVSNGGLDIGGINIVVQGNLDKSLNVDALTNQIVNQVNTKLTNRGFLRSANQSVS